MNTHSLARREDERMFFSWWFRGKRKKKVPDKTMVALGTPELRQQAAERQQGLSSRLPGTTGEM